MTDPGAGPAGARPLRLAPFRAVRYSTGHAHDLAAVTCPPYDVIGENGVATWEAADPFNVVRLILPRAGSGENRYTHAARDLQAWLTAGVLRRDSEAALYVYEHATATSIALGLVGAVSLHDPDEGVVLPHEDVFAAPVADRTALMAATGAQLEPILLTYEGDGAASDLVDAARGAPPLVDATTADGATHRLWRLTDAATHDAVEADLAGRRALIADGHHRYAAYRALRAQTDPGRPGAARGLAMLVDARRHPLRLSAIHRSVARLTIHDAVDAATRGFRVCRPLRPGADVVTALAEEGRDGPAYAIGSNEDAWVLLTDPYPQLVDAALPAERSPTWRRLDASIALAFLLGRLWGLADADERVAYHHEPAGAVERAQRLRGVAVLLNAPRHDDVLAVAACGERMPRKSTSFGPKPRTGLLMRLLTDPMPGDRAPGAEPR
ncbi:MAG: DUF1015 family protein [Jiangellaceae bacterium]